MKTLFQSGCSKLVLVLASLGTCVQCQAQEAIAEHADSSPATRQQRERDAALQFITIADPSLPEQVRLVKQTLSAPLIDARKNPNVVVEPSQLRLVAMFFGISRKADFQPEFVGLSAIYQTDDPSDEIGIYGLLYADAEAAKKRFDQLAKNRKDSPYVLKGKLLLYLWMDDNVNAHALQKMRKHLQSKEFSPAQES